MAWSAPATAVTGDVITAAFWNTNGRDNLNALSGHLHTGVAGDGSLLAGRTRLSKSADQSVSGTTLTNDTHLVLAKAAGEVWFITYYLAVTGSDGSDLKLAVTIPAGDGMLFMVNGGTAQGGLGSGTISHTATSGAAINVVWGASSAPAVICSVIAGGPTAGNIQLQFAENTAVGSVTLKGNSTGIAMRVS